MKKLISFLLSALTIVSMIFYSLPVSAASVENPYSQFIDDPYYKVTSNYLNEIVDKLSNLKSSGNTCIVYLGEEILLHRAILFSTNNIQSYSSNPELNDIADDMLDNYTGELREMRDELAGLINNYSKDKKKVKENNNYIKDYGVIIDKLKKELSQISTSDSNEIVYIKQAVAILQASYDISSINNNCVESPVAKEIAKNEINNTQAYISRLKTLENSLK